LEFGREIRDARFTDVLLLGMGGSSLCPDVLARTFGHRSGFPALHVLDSTVPAQIRSVQERLDLRRTLCIVASKSGTTLEPKALMDYFWERLKVEHGSRTGARFVAITDPDSELEETARTRSFRRVFLGTPSIGGRFSALSCFGMAPGAAAGIDVSRLLSRAKSMAVACRTSSVEEGNPGVELGLTLGSAARSGRDKLTILASPALGSLGGWLEQLVAESTGKHGKAIIPIDREPVTAIDIYGDDRIFVALQLADEPDALQIDRLEALVQSGHPVISIELADRYDLGAEFFRWEIATAVACSVMGVNPFDQPDVEASKVATRELTSSYEETGSLPEEAPVAELGDLELYGDPDYVETLAGGERDLGKLVWSHLERLQRGDYFALLAFLEMSPDHEQLLQQMRDKILERFSAATSLGFGPRYLHSTGQAYKGGPNTGVFLQITSEDLNDLAVPKSGYTFGTIKAAQARGDFAVLVERNRKALRLHLKGDPDQGLLNLLQLLN
jgi:transaldolase/glucose-6-phosphate isomerase